MSDESESPEEIGCVLDDIGDRLLASNSYLKVYYEPAYGFQIEVYRTNDPGHMRDTELNRTHAVIVDSSCLEDAFMELNKKLTISEQPA